MTGTSDNWGGEGMEGEGTEKREMQDRCWTDWKCAMGLGVVWSSRHGHGPIGLMSPFCLSVSGPV